MADGMVQKPEYKIVKDVRQITLSQMGNADIGINKNRPIFGIYSNDRYDSTDGIALLLYFPNINDDWYVHAVKSSSLQNVIDKTISITVFYGELINT